MKKILTLIILVLSCAKFIKDIEIKNKDINDDLVLAIINNKEYEARKLIEKGANVNYIYNNKTLIELAIDEGNLNIIKTLIEIGAELNEQSIIKLYNLALEDFNYGIINLIKDRYKLKEGIIDNNKYFLLLCYTSKVEEVKKFVEKNNINPEKIKDKNNRNGLIIACIGGKADIVRFLLKQNEINVNYKDSQEITPLIAAFNRSSSNKLIKMLIEKGADIGSKDKYGFTALMLAAKFGYQEVADLLIQKGADVNDKNLYNFTALILASNNGYKGIVDLLIEKGANINDNDIYGYTALMQALKNGHTEVVKLLIEKGANINDETHNGDIPLIMAYEKGNVEIAKLLIEKGANNIKPIVLASRKGYKSLIELLLEKGANINEKDKNGLTPLLLLVSKGSSKEAIELLIEKGANINNRDNYGNTALMIASQNGNFGLVKLFLEREAGINKKNYIEDTALMIASEKGHIKIVKLLLKKGADVNGKNINSYTSLIQASENGHVEVSKTLIERGANINDKTKIKTPWPLLIFLPAIKSISGNTSLMVASENGHIEMIKLLTDLGADVNVKNDNGDSALILASANCHVEIVKLLLKKGANINDKNSKNLTAFAVALQNGHKEIIKLLIENAAKVSNIKDNIIEDTLVENIKGNNIESSLLIIYKYRNKINFNYRDKEGNTFLHYVALSNNLSLFMAFTSKFKNLNLLNINGESPLYFALSSSKIDQDFIWYLINQGSLLKPSSYIKDKLLLDILLPYEGLCDKLIYEPLTIKLLDNTKLNFKDKNKIKEIIKILKLRDEDFENEVQMIKFIKNTLIDSPLEINLNQIVIREDDNQDIELNIEVFSEIFQYFENDDYWPSIVKKGIERIKEDFKKKLLIIEQYKPVNRSLLNMSSEERLQNTNFKRKKKLAKLLRLISKTAKNGYNNDKIKFVINQILDIVSCNEGSLEAIEDAIRYLSGEESTEIKDIINDELMHLRYNILKEICVNKIKINLNGVEEIVEITPHTFPQLVKEMSEQLKLKIEYLDEEDYHFIYNKSEIINLVLAKYKERIIEYTRDKIQENRVLWNKVRDYIEREIYKGRSVLQVDDFIYDEEYRIKKEAIKALLIHFKIY